MEHNTFTLADPKSVDAICAELGMKSWYRDSANSNPLIVTNNGAERIMNYMGLSKEDIAIPLMRQGLQVELEHGCINPETNITNNHPIITALIVMVHHRESKMYYPKLAIMEKELDLHKPISKIYKAIQKYDIQAIRKAVEYFEKIDEDEEEGSSLNATEIAIANLI